MVLNLILILYNIKYMKNTIFLACFALSDLSSCTSTANRTKKQWVSLFNGKDLEGWDIKISGYELNNNYKNTFRVEHGLLRGHVMMSMTNSMANSGTYSTKHPFHITSSGLNTVLSGSRLPEVRHGVTGTAG